MRARFASHRLSRAVQFATASAIAGTLFPVISVLAAAPAIAATTHTYAAHVTEAAQRFGIAEAWIWAVMSVESNGDPAAISRAGAMGLMQIMPATWAGLTARYRLGDNPWDARANIYAGAAYLREMIDRYRDLSTALAAYNAGPGRADDWRMRGRPLPPETVAYVAKIAPMIGTSDLGWPASTVPVRSSSPALSWRRAALFAVRDSGASAGEKPAADAAQAAQPGGTRNALAGPTSGPASPIFDGLFVALSRSGER